MRAGEESASSQVADGPPEEEVPQPPLSRVRLVKRAIRIGAFLFAVIIVWLVVTAPLSRSLQPVGAPGLTILSAEGEPIGLARLEARPIAPDGTVGATFKQVILARAGTPAFARERPVVVRRDASGKLLLEVSYTGQAAMAEASLTGVSSLALRAVHGNLAQVSPAAMFAYERRLLAYPRADAPGKITFLVPTSADVPLDGVIIADVALRDPFGRAVHTSAVEFT